MTALPAATAKKLGLVIDLDTCVGCHACAVACKQWNDIGAYGPLDDRDPYGRKPEGVWFNRVHSYEVEPAFEAPLPPGEGLGRGSGGTSRSHSARTLTPIPSPEGSGEQVALTLHFPRSCLHCAQAACVTVCPTGASYKRAEDGIVLVDEDKCIGCKLCSWACPYGAREYDLDTGVMKKCTLCVDRIDNQNLDPLDRQPACVQACPTRARHFGDLADPNSDVSRLVADRGGVDLLQELGYAPTNKYLPPRPRRAGSVDQSEPPVVPASSPLHWLDRVLRR